MAKKTNPFKVGDEATMLFHGFGIVSEEQWPVIKVRGKVVTLDTDEDPKKCKQFDVETGRCLNDVTDFGCYRTLKVK